MAASEIYRPQGGFLLRCHPQLCLLDPHAILRSLENPYRYQTASSPSLACIPGWAALPSPQGQKLPGRPHWLSASLGISVWLSQPFILFFILFQFCFTREKMRIPISSPDGDQLPDGSRTQRAVVRSKGKGHLRPELRKPPRCVWHTQRS